MKNFPNYNVFTNSFKLKVLISGSDSNDFIFRPMLAVRQHTDPNSYSWCLIRYSIVKLVRHSLLSFLPHIGLEIQGKFKKISIKILYSEISETQSTQLLPNIGLEIQGKFTKISNSYSTVKLVRQFILPHIRLQIQGKFKKISIKILYSEISETQSTQLLPNIGLEIQGKFTKISNSYSTVKLVRQFILPHIRLQIQGKFKKISIKILYSEISETQSTQLLPNIGLEIQGKFTKISNSYSTVKLVRQFILPHIRLQIQGKFKKISIKILYSEISETQSTQLLPNIGLEIQGKFTKISNSYSTVKLVRQFILPHIRLQIQGKFILFEVTETHFTLLSTSYWTRDAG